MTESSSHPGARTPTGAIERELEVTKGFASCLGDLAAIREAEEECKMLRAKIAMMEAAFEYANGGLPWDQAVKRAATGASHD